MREGSCGRDRASSSSGLPASGCVQGPSCGPLYQHPAGSHGSCHLNCIQPHWQVSHWTALTFLSLFVIVFYTLIYLVPVIKHQVEWMKLYIWLWRHTLWVCCRYLASGSGDTTVRFWDLMTETPHHTARGINSPLYSNIIFEVSR